MRCGHRGARAPDPVDTRRYLRVIPEMADTVGVSRSTVSRESIEASEAALKQLLERRFDEVELLIISILSATSLVLVLFVRNTAGFV